MPHSRFTFTNFLNKFMDNVKLLLNQKILNCESNTVYSRVLEQVSKQLLKICIISFLDINDSEREADINEVGCSWQ